MLYLKLWKHRDLFQKSGESFLAVLILNAKQPYHKYKKRAEIKNSALFMCLRLFGAVVVISVFSTFQYFFIINAVLGLIQFAVYGK